MDMNSRTKRTSMKFTTVKGYLLMYFSTDNGMYQVITFLEIHSNIVYSSFIFKFLYLYQKPYSLQLFNLMIST